MISVHGLLQSPVEEDVGQTVVPVLGANPSDGGSTEPEFTGVVLDIGKAIIAVVEAVLIGFGVPVPKAEY